MQLSRQFAVRACVTMALALPAFGFGASTQHVHAQRSAQNWAGYVVALEDITAQGCTMGYGHSEAEAESNSSPCPPGSAIYSHPVLLTSALSAHLRYVAPVRLSDGTIDNAATIAAVNAAARAMYRPMGVGPRLAPLACVFNGLPMYPRMSYGPGTRTITAEVRYFDALSAV